jgi:hypothetical protein
MQSIFHLQKAVLFHVEHSYNPLDYLCLPHRYYFHSIGTSLL